MTLSQQQQDALTRIKRFMWSPDQSVFILKGYAGTGKTFLVKNMISEILKIGKTPILLAPTGRAAKILKEKTEYAASTIHRVIYALENVQVVRHNEQGKIISDNDNERVRSKGVDDLQFFFSIKEHREPYSPENMVFIVDESSMISSRPSDNEILHFGSDVLIDDLMTYIQPRKGGKIIFIGDPAQLPPVGDNRSAALETSFFTEKNLSVEEFVLTEVVRQDSNSQILKDAMQVRDLLAAERRNQLCFECKTGEVENINAEQVIDRFIEQHPTPEIGKSVIICYANALVKDYNDAIRRRYYGQDTHVVAGDVLQVVRNNINANTNVEFYNGDFVKVIEASDKIETLSAPVWTDVAGKRERFSISIDFRDVVLLTEDGHQTRCKIVDTLLQSNKPYLTPLQSTALYINFRMRHSDLKPKDEGFKDNLMVDPYFNAIQVKYGYAITGHKSQGGEWETVFVDYSGRVGFSNDSLRWIYTATTRASKTLYGVNMPRITPISKLEFSNIVTYNKLSKEALSYAEVGDIDLLPSSASLSQKHKCLSVKSQLDDKGFILRSIQPLQYNDRYSIEVPSGTIIVDCLYNGSGQYTRYNCSSCLQEKDDVLAAFENESNILYKYDYKPSIDALGTLYWQMASICNDLDIIITNVVEHVSQFYVGYYLITSGKFAQILFYFNNNHVVTRAIPSSSIGPDDTKLQKLISAFIH